MVEISDDVCVTGSSFSVCFLLFLLSTAEGQEAAGGQIRGAAKLDTNVISYP